MSSVRNAAVAGQFYEGDSERLKMDVDALLATAQTKAPCPKVLIAPHAGYIYSGPIAAEVYARLANARQPITRVVLLGPSHRVGFRGIASSSALAFSTPLGNIPLDRAALSAIAQLPGVQERDDAHALEHSLEVHLPFLQRSLGEFKLVPLVVGDAPAEEVATVLNKLWSGPETLVVISSDLSHYLPYGEAQARDANTARRIESLDASLSGEEACGCRPLNGLLTVLKERSLGITRVVVKNSGDTAGDRDRVVGYGAWVVNDTGATRGTGDDESAANSEYLSLAQRQQLLHLARGAITHGLHSDGNMDIPLNNYDGILREKRGSFVTLNLDGQLRGCIGNLAATRPLILDVAHNAGAAAFKDPRFKPLTAAEYPRIDVHISVLSAPRKLTVASREALLEYLQPGVHGVIIEEGERRSTYLPSVWEKLPDPDTFVAELRAKAGLQRNGWSADTRVSIYTTEEFN
jgi:AmmeMemoRadiSam system protein B/AmmeMemoRadiSam system protein A